MLVSNTQDHHNSSTGMYLEFIHSQDTFSAQASKTKLGNHDFLC